MGTPKYGHPIRESLVTGSCMGMTIGNAWEYGKSTLGIGFAGTHVEEQIGINGNRPRPKSYYGLLYGMGCNVIYGGMLFPPSAMVYFLIKYSLLTFRSCYLGHSDLKDSHRISQISITQTCFAAVVVTQTRLSNHKRLSWLTQNPPGSHRTLVLAHAEPFVVFDLWLTQIRLLYQHSSPCYLSSQPRRS
ncbi:hypothetical protein R6Q59_031895 [Mikania micrantha]